MQNAKENETPSLNIADTRETLALLNMILGCVLRRAGGVIVLTEDELKRPAPDVRWRSRHEPTLTLTVVAEEGLIGITQLVTHPELNVPVGEPN